MNPVAASSLAPQAAKPDPALRKAAEAFEAVILRQMLANIRSAKLGDDIFGSSATDNFREMADARLADNMASLRQFGIADLVERQLGAQTSCTKNRKSSC
jgi:peptidoglycan hydrolase FlgJ